MTPIYALMGEPAWCAGSEYSGRPGRAGTPPVPQRFLNHRVGALKRSDLQKRAIIALRTDQSIDTSMPTTRQTPKLAYIAASIALLVIFAAYRPVMEVWYFLLQRPPSGDEIVELLRSTTKEGQSEGLRLASRMNPASDEVLHVASELALSAADLDVRQQAAHYLGNVAQKQALPEETLLRIPRLTPELDDHLATAYASLIQHSVQHRRPPPNAVAFLDALIEQRDWHVKNVAVRAFGQIGFYHGLDDARIAQLTAMATDVHERGRAAHSAEVAWALKLVGQKQPLPPSTVETLVEILREDRDANARQNAVSALSTQLTSAPGLIDAIEAALQDTDARVRGAAQRVLYQLEIAQPIDVGQDLQVAADDQEPATRRLRALQRLIRQDPADDRVRAVIEALSRHADATLRAGVASIAGALPADAADALLLRAQADSDPQVRAAAVLPLIARAAADGDDARIRVVEQLLGDDAPEVQRKVLVAIRSNELNTHALRSALRDMTTSDPQLARDRTALLTSLERASRTPLQRLWDGVVDPQNYGVFAFVTVAVIAFSIFVSFLVYFAARCFVYLSARRWRAATVLGTIVAWLGASFALGWAFFIGAFVGGGHNSAPALSDQLLVVGILLLLVVVYALLGFGLRFLTRA